MFLWVLVHKDGKEPNKNNTHVGIFVFGNTMAVEGSIVDEKLFRGVSDGSNAKRQSVHIHTINGFQGHLKAQT